MAWYDGTYSCGHEGCVNIIGPTKNREWIRERKFSELCPECCKKERAAEIERVNSAAKESSFEMELPELSGSEKQVNWANTIRLTFIEKIQSVITRLEESEAARERYARSFERRFGIKEDSLSAYYGIMNYSIAQKTSARYWIDNRDFNNAMMECLFDEYRNNKENEFQDVPQEIIDESLIKPENSDKTGIVKIEIKCNTIIATYEKNDIFRAIMNKLGYAWSGQWEKSITETTGPAEERAAELGNHLLNAGFTVSIMDQDIRKNAIAANFEPECKRWIYKRETSDLAAKWPKGEQEEIYANIRKIPTSRWDRPYVLVDVSHYEEVEDFAEIYGFKFTMAARKMIDEYVNRVSRLEKIVPAKPIIPGGKDGLKEVLNSSREVLEDLIDDD